MLRLAIDYPAYPFGMSSALHIIEELGNAREHAEAASESLNDATDAHQ
jgi:hypothetical protein